jgi:hypothetical protein
LYRIDVNLRFTKKLIYGNLTTLQPYNLTTLQPYNLTITLIKIWFLTFLFATLFFSCNEKQNLEISNEALSTQIVTCPPEEPPFVHYYTECSQVLNCTRKDLNPCDFATNGDYASEVACELTKFLNNCPRKVGRDCEASRMTICMKLLEPQFLANTNPPVRIWTYCFNRTDCSPQFCVTDEGNFLFNNPISQAMQDQIIQDVLNFSAKLAILGTYCQFSDDNRMEIEKVVLYTERQGINCGIEATCTNFVIKARITLACYIPGGACW